MTDLGDTITVTVRGERLTGIVVRVPEGDGYGALHGEGGELVTWTAADVVEHRRANGEATTWRGWAPRRATMWPEDLAAAEGRAAGWRRRALLAEAGLEEAHVAGWYEAEDAIMRVAHDAADRYFGVDPGAGLALRMQRFAAEVRSQLALAMHWGAELAGRVRSQEWLRARGDSTPAYLAGKRDQLAIEQHRDALVQDVLRLVARVWDRGGAAYSDENRRVLEAWDSAGRPGLGGKHG